MSNEIRRQCLDAIKAVLLQYNASITAEDHWQGYPECGEDVRMTVEFDDWRIEDIELGRALDGETGGPL